MLPVPASNPISGGGRSFGKGSACTIVELVGSLVVTGGSVGGFVVAVLVGGRVGGFVVTAVFVGGRVGGFVVTAVFVGGRVGAFEPTGKLMVLAGRLLFVRVLRRYLWLAWALGRAASKSKADNLAMATRADEDRLRMLQTTFYGSLVG